MLFAVISLILFSLFLASMILLVRYLTRSVNAMTYQMAQVTSQQNSTLKHLANLLSTKDPIAFQQIQAATSLGAPERASHEVNGVYLSGDEIELLEASQRELDELWKQIED